MDVTEEGMVMVVMYSPFHFSVAPAPLSPSDCVLSLKTTATFDPSTGANLTLQVDAYDEFKNLITDNDNLVAVIDGDINNAIPLLAPTYTHDLNFPKDEERQIKIGFLYVKNGGYQHLPGSPVLIQVAPPPPPVLSDTGIPPATIGGIVAGVLAVASLAFYYVHRKHQKKAAAVEARMEQEQLQLQQRNENLQDSLRKKKHSDAELVVMQKAMDGQNKERADELKSVLIPSSEIDIVELLGQGGMGKVHLALYNKQEVAVKQLLAITDENCKRFR